MEEILQFYYENNAKKLRSLVDQILVKLGSAADKDSSDFYSIANEVFTDVVKQYDGKRSFAGFLYSCLCNKFKTELTARNRQKRLAE